MPPIRTYHELTELDKSDLLGQVVGQRARVQERLARVGRVIAVMSGKGGVGKSFVTAALAAELARRGSRVGVVDADLHGPTAARMLGVSSAPLAVTESGAVPATGCEGVRVMSTDLLLPEGAALRWKEPGHETFVWRGTLETGMLREFLADVAWGELDVLLVDLPPGTERLTALHELVPNLAGVLVVTIPSDASRRAVRRSLDVARQRGIPILGIVENMAGHACIHCGQVSPLFEGHAAADLAAAVEAPRLAAIPFDHAAQAEVDAGRMPKTGPALDAVRALATKLAPHPAHPGPHTP